jgi:hypothetical protein
MIRREQFERVQGLLRSVYDDLVMKRFVDGPPDSYFWTTFRESLDRAGATDEDRRHIAAYFIRWMASEGDRDTVCSIIELVAEHLVGEDMEIGFDRAGRVTYVACPNADHVLL